MPFATQELQSAYNAYRQFLNCNPPLHHARYIFPLFTGSYFAYRKVDVVRVIAIARAVSENPCYVDIGCGYGDFLKKVRQLLPDATGIEKDASLFYAFQIPKPDYINLMPAEGLSQPIDLAFVGWMEPGQDFRRFVAKCAKCIITTLDTGGQCGINGGCEYDEFGFQRVAWWRTPSWEDVNTEIMNRYYTKMPSSKRTDLAKMRGAHNLWYVYAKPQKVRIVREALKRQVEKESPADHRYNFESVLDECGYGYLQKLENPATLEPLWQVQWN